MTIEQILEQEKVAHAQYEKTTIVTAEGESITDLRKIFDAVCNQEDWKFPWAAAVPSQVVGAVLRAVEFFHADRPEIVGVAAITGKVLLQGRGYQG